METMYKEKLLPLTEVGSIRANFIYIAYWVNNANLNDNGKDYIKNPEKYDSIIEDYEGRIDKRTKRYESVPLNEEQKKDIQKWYDEKLVKIEKKKSKSD